MEVHDFDKLIKGNIILGIIYLDNKWPKYINLENC